MKCPKAVKATNETAWVPECLCAVSLLKLTAEDNPLPALLLLLLRDAESALKTARLSEEKSASSYQPLNGPVQVQPKLKPRHSKPDFHYQFEPCCGSSGTSLLTLPAFQ